MVTSALVGLNFITIYAMEDGDIQDKNPTSKTTQSGAPIRLIGSGTSIDSIFEKSNSFVEHIKLVKHYNSETLGGFDQSKNTSYNPELSQKCLDRILSLLNQRNDYYVEAVAYLKTTLTFISFSSSPLAPKEGPLNYIQAILKRVAEIGRPYDKFIYAEKGAERSCTSFNPYLPFDNSDLTAEAEELYLPFDDSNFTAEAEEVELWKKFSMLQTDEEREIFHTNVAAPYWDKKAIEAAEKDIQDNFSPPLLCNEGKLFSIQTTDIQTFDHTLFELQQKVTDFIKRGILENAAIIGATSVPRVKKLSEIEIAIQPAVLEPLGVLYTAARENGKGDYVTFWLEVKRLLEQKVIRFLRANNFKPNNAFVNDERNQWYARAVAQLIEEQDPEALNYYRISLPVTFLKGSIFSQFQEV